VDRTGPGGDVRACDSCGVGDDRLEQVHRVYLDIDELGRAHEVSTVAATEWWCPACRVTYPNKPEPGAPTGS
jgi:hypothetical protein